MYPRLIVDTDKIKKNVDAISNKAERIGLALSGVTKSFAAREELVQAYIDGGVKYLADSRIINLKRLEKFDLPKMLLRLPMISEVEDVVRYADISLNSELDTIAALSDAAVKSNKEHSIILMVDLGDLREGYYEVEDLYNDIEKMKNFENINIVGIGTNFTCYGGVIPNARLHRKQIEIANKIKERFNIDLEIISGGNTSSVHLLDSQGLEGINNLRVGESLLFGTDSAYGGRFEDTYNDCFTLEVEIIEMKDKPSVPTEEIGRDAFGQVPTFEDRGIRKRMIGAIGKQDVDFETLYPYDSGLIILGGSSDHIIIDASDSKVDYRIGDKIKFNIHYVSLLRLMNSEYVSKTIL